MDTPSVTPATADEFDACVDVADVAFHGDTTPERRARMRAWMDTDRLRVVRDDGRIVATSAAWSWSLSVPGGSLPVSAVTIVTVLPTHRRRGILRAMMTRLAEEARERGEPLAALWASEGAIYGRFGFGPASWSRELRASLAAGLPLRAGTADAPAIRLVPRAADAHRELAAIHERACTRRAGLVDRREPWWTRRVLADDPAERGGAGPLRAAVAGTDGYALYRVREGAETSPVAAWTTVEVAELVGATAEAERALLAFVASIDLADELVLASRPVDDPLVHAPVDARALLPGTAHDALWLRILDLPAAVAGRSWAAPLDLTLAIEHAEDAGVAGTWRLAGGPDGATAERTDGPPDLVLHARELASLYLGGVTAAALRDAGVLREATDGAVDRFDAALRVVRAPWTTGVF
ncbi:GNAT family N-acetyltransferase [Patulibacter sp.]|uniref:GNAT family N-acetyltransferase n=1 Tax=Patulibacter sp. TaxID=1912859 RepID=UPI0027197AB4|nr:GNAT family N-acetyltransferase [Patulibacter sp.]MDO9407258.1 GNAT family N-acetyltransferase [Patulibacter sp.]